MQKVTVSQAVNLFQTLVEAGLCPFLWGPPGGGKTSVVQQLAEMHKRKVFSFRAVLQDIVDARGLPYAGEDGTTKWMRPSSIPPLDGGPSILFLDELPQGPPALQAALLQATHERKIGDHKLPDNCWVIAAGNRVSDRAGAMKLISAMANRFCHFELQTSVEDWAAWGTGKIIPEMIAYMRYRPAMLMQFDPKLDELAYPTPRSWEMLSNAITQAGKPDEPTVLRLATAIVGEGAAAEFVAFRQSYKSLVPLATVMKDLSQFPTEVGTQYALMSEIENFLEKKKPTPELVKVGMAFPEELSVALLKSVVKRDTSLLRSSAIVPWLAKYKEISDDAQLA